MSYKLSYNFLQTSIECLTNFYWTSYKLLLNFLQTPYKLLMNFLQLLLKSSWIYYEILTTLIILIVWQNTKSNISINLILIVLVNSSPDFSLKSEEALHLKDRKKFFFWLLVLSRTRKTNIFTTVILMFWRNKLPQLHS